jgi:hypothetical protein
MASPVAHSLTGYLIYHLTARQDEADCWPPLWAYIAIANVPDIDILFGLLQNAPFRYHHESIANSIGLTLGFTLLAWSCSHAHPRAPRWRHGWLYLTLYGVHVLLDFFGYERAVPILWPLDRRTYTNPLGFMPGLFKSHTSNVQFVTSLWHGWNGAVLLIEGAIFLPGIYLVKRWRGQRS